MSSAVTVTMRTGERLVLRPEPSTDLAMAYEILLAGAYEPPAALPKISPRRIVDVGANVGFSVVLWAKLFPVAEILAFEPHPEHLQQLYSHVLRNGLAHRVEVVGAAVSDRKARAHITSDDAESRVVDERTKASFPILVRDFFEEVGSDAIDLLKMDIEGGEFEILSDPRFASLQARTIVLEWHNTARTPDGRSFCETRLRTLGYRTAPGKLDYGRAGILWAWRAS